MKEKDQESDSESSQGDDMFLTYEELEYLNNEYKLIVWILIA